MTTTRVMIGLLLLAAGYWFFYDQGPSGPIADRVPEAALSYRPPFAPPTQTGFRQESPKTAFRFRTGGHVVSALADVQVAARVLSTQKYTADREAILSPIDFALGWGPMANPGVLLDISIYQDRRFFFWQVTDWPIPREDIERHSANTHLIPATQEIREFLEAVEVGEEVLLEGQLVQVDGADGWRWKSSMTRRDTGAGACEIIWVSYARRLKEDVASLGN